jgi:arylsulfatase
MVTKMPEYIRNMRIPAFLLVLIASVPLAVGAAEGDDKPNIVLVLMDNFGYGEIGVYGGGVLRGAATPNIDGIATEGFQLTNFNVEAECTPSRSALMTGRYGIRTRQRQDGPPRGVWYGITKWEITLAEMLSDSGYATGIFGKWHLGDTEGRYPTDQGQAPSSPTSCRQSEVKSPWNWKCTVARSARRSIAKSPTRPSIS